LNNKAVSPVIATILMVAITVVLAAVLYVMVMGFGTDGGDDTPSGSFTMTERYSDTEQKIVFGQITPNTNITECKVIVNGVTFTTADAAAWSAAGVDYVDLAKDDKISAGDYLIVTAATGSNTVSLIFTATGDLIDDVTFTF